MNIGDRKMHFLGNYNHDFPRLAKQSGFFFQLYRGKVNWSEIECLNLDDITQNQNFELLEQHLLNVINCNLEKDYDLKILDRNLVKLFKIAQLGIDYLSYCELYLDRCVVLLQEQLMSLQKELQLLKNENEEKNSELKKTKIKKKINSHQCEKCDKVFISDVYLKFHDKRRHGSLLPPEIKEELSTKLVDASQQTENKRTLSVAIQTLLDESGDASRKNEEIRKIKKSHNRKIKRLEKNLNDVKARLQKAEKSLRETREANSNWASGSFPSSLHYHPLLQFAPSYFPSPRTRIEEALAECQKSFPNGRSPVLDSVAVINTKIIEDQKSPASGHTILKEYNADGSERNSEAAKIDLICNKENVDPQDPDTKPLPPPRTKKKIQNVLCAEENVATETFNQLGGSVHFVTNTDSYSNQAIDLATVKGETEPNNYLENMKRVRGKKTDSNESINITKEQSEELCSFFKKYVQRSSPKLQKLSTNLKRPLTNLYCSMSSRRKNLMSVEKKPQSVKGILIDDLNNQLRELGIDPEWNGIPKKTMKQKLKYLTHRRNLLFKENAFYISARESAEEKIFEKMKRKFCLRKTSPHNSCGQEIGNEVYPSYENLPFKSQESKNVGNGNCAILYDTDVDSWSEPDKSQRKQTSPSWAPPSQQKVSANESEESEKKFDIHVFQIKKASLEKKQVNCKNERKETGELSTNFSSSSSEGFFKTVRVEK